MLFLPLPAAAQVCTGDCDGDGAVTVNEIVTTLNIALGTRPLQDCPAGDDSGDGSITVDEIVASLNFALTGCPIITPAVTPTASPTPTTDAGDAVRIDVGSGSGLPGSVVRIAVTMSNGGDLVTAISNDITYDTTHVRVVENDGQPCQINPEIGPGTPFDKMLISNIPIVDGSRETVRVGVIAFSNQVPIPDGVIYTCDFRLAPAAPAGTVALENEPDASDAAGEQIPSIGNNGLITIR